MPERFEADLSRPYRAGVNAAPVLGLPLAIASAVFAGLEWPWVAVWPVAVTLALLSQRWIMLGVRYELAHDRLTIVTGPFRRHVPWSTVGGLRGARHRRYGVAGFALRLRGGGAVVVAPRERARFIREVARLAPHARLEGDPRWGEGSAAPVGVDDVA